jgi:hypothetical protein
VVAFDGPVRRTRLLGGVITSTGERPDPISKVRGHRTDISTGTLQAQACTIRHRNANACDDFARRDYRTNVTLSSSVNTNSAFGRPVFGMHHRLHIVNEFQALDTSPLTRITTQRHRPSGGAAHVCAAPGRRSPSPW